MSEMKMDANRSICGAKMLMIIVALAATLILSSWDLIRANVTGSSHYGVIDMLGTALMMDKFKVLMAMLTAGIYTAGFCYDFKHHYIRMILARTDLINYSISKFVVNTIAVVLACIASFYLFSIVAVYFFKADWTQIRTVPCYYQIGYRMPLLYIGMMALQFGMVCAMCSAVGMLFSVFQPNTFVCIGISGMVFFSAISYIPLGSIVDVYNLISMQPTLPRGQNTMQGIQFLWGMLYPICVILICTYLFYRRMKWREQNGFL